MPIVAYTTRPPGALRPHQSATVCGQSTQRAGMRRGHHSMAGIIHVAKQAPFLLWVDLFVSQPWFAGHVA